MVNGDITVSGKPVGGKPASRERNDAPTDALIGPDSGLRGVPSAPRRQGEPRCPAMSEQQTDISNEAAPQGFVRLIGCCDSRRGRSFTPDAAGAKPAPRSR